MHDGVDLRLPLWGQWRRGRRSLRGLRYPQHPNYPQAFPRIQIITVDDLLVGKRPTMPPVVMPYIQAQRKQISEHQGALLEA